MQSHDSGARIVYLANSTLGVRVLQWLVGQGEQVVGLVLHPERKRRSGQELLDAGGVASDQVIVGSHLSDPKVLDAIRSWNADIAVSVLFGYIVKPDFIDLFPRGVVNLHPGLLPWNRGAYPNVWSIVDETPAGATLHYIDPGVDTGPIIDQQPVVVEPVDTGETLYRKLEDASFDLFTRSWQSVRDGRAASREQIGQGTHHRTRDVDEVDRIDLDRRYRARDLINLLRARTFPPYTGAYFEVGGRKVYLRLELGFDDEE